MTTHLRELPNLIIKNGTQLTPAELTKIKEAIFREFKVTLSDRDNSKDKLFSIMT